MIIELGKKDKDKIQELSKLFYDIVGDVEDDLSNNPFSHYIVYYENEKLVGYINYYLIYDRIEIANFNVLEEYQNKGIGTKLLKFLIECYDQKITNITLEVRSNNLKAINIYKKMGFKEKAIRKNYYKDIDGILMERCVM